ncbi:MAG: hypothetical protein GYA73_12175, partial [Planctomycetes bacterium]|nr:hypothetical protein [Planctomycetota bacterium]
AGPDSRGLFQQRANGAWGTLADRMNPTIASTNFFKALTAVPGYLSMEPTLAAHKAQRNADPYHYQPYWADAVLMVSTLTADPSLLESLPAGGRFSAAAFHRDGLFAAAGVRYGAHLFTGSLEALLFTELDQRCFIRADANSDGRINLADASAVLAYLFGGGELTCLDAADVDDDGHVNLTDPIRLLLYLFSVGRQPPPPFPVCGPDATHDLLPCAAAPACPSPGCP